MAKRAPRPPSTRVKRQSGQTLAEVSRDEALIAERRVRALQLRVGGASYRKIAQQLDVSVQTAYSDVNTELIALRGATEEQAEAYRELELERLDEWTLNMTIPARQGDPRAVNALVRIADRRAKLLGLDAPTKHAHEGSITVDISGARERLAGVLASLAARQRARELPPGTQR